MHATPNGGARDARTGATLRREGTKAGVSDLKMPIPHGKYRGLAIEMKAPDGKVKPLQEGWLKMHDLMGWRTAVAYSSLEAENITSAYVSLEPQYDVVALKNIVAEMKAEEEKIAAAKARAKARKQLKSQSNGSNR